MTLLLVAIAGVGLLFAVDQKGVRRGPQADHRLAGAQVIIDELHLVIGQVAEAREDDHQVRRLQGLQPRDVVVAIGIDGAVLVDGEQHGAFEAVMFRQDLRQHAAALPRSDTPHRR